MNPFGLTHHDAMILYFVIHCKIFLIKMNEKKLNDITTEFFCSHLGINDADLPKCAQCGGDVKLFSRYKRNLTTLKRGPVSLKSKYEYDGETLTETQTVDVQRVKCKNQNCGATHAILSDGIIPYCTFSAATILTILSYGLMPLEMRGVSIAEMCAQFGISESTYYRLLRRFKGCLRELCAVLKNASLNGADAVKYIREKCRYDEFGYNFREMTGKSFMQSHANPKREVFRHRKIPEVSPFPDGFFSE